VRESANLHKSCSISPYISFCKTSIIPFDISKIRLRDLFVSPIIIGRHLRLPLVDASHFDNSTMLTELTVLRSQVHCTCCCRITHEVADLRKIVITVYLIWQQRLDKRHKVHT